MSTNLQQRMDELIANGSVAAVMRFSFIFIIDAKIDANETFSFFVDFKEN